MNTKKRERIKKLGIQNLIVPTKRGIKKVSVWLKYTKTEELSQSSIALHWRELQNALETLSVA
jgi:hypothetical protein